MDLKYAFGYARLGVLDKRLATKMRGNDMINKNCVRCETQITPLEEFPGGICVDCYAIDFDNQLMPTAQDIVSMFRGSINI